MGQNLHGMYFTSSKYRTARSHVIFPNPPLQISQFESYEALIMRNIDLLNHYFGENYNRIASCNKSLNHESFVHNTSVYLPPLNVQLAKKRPSRHHWRWFGGNWEKVLLQVQVDRWCVLSNSERWVFTLLCFYERDREREDVARRNVSASSWIKRGNNNEMLQLFSIF